MSVLAYIPIHVFGRSPIIYPVTGIPGVPSMRVYYPRSDGNGYYISCALESIFWLFSPQSKIHFPCGIECPSYKQVCFSSSLQDDECFGSEIQFTLWSVTYYIPSNRYPWCSLLSAPYYDLGPPVESDFPEFVTRMPGNISFALLLPQWSFLLLLLRSQLVSLQWIYFPFGILFPVWVLHSPVSSPVCFFCVSLIRVVSCSRYVSFIFPSLESCLVHTSLLLLLSP